jgi:uncharacterized repeat protein (TIGR01451 family)
MNELSSFASGLKRPRFAAALLALAMLSSAHADPIVKLLTFQDTPDPVSSTQQLTYHLQVSNTSFTTPSANTLLTVPIPSGVTFVSVSDAACSYGAPNVVCNFGTLAVLTDKFIDITLYVTAAGGSTLNSTAVASSTTLGESDSSIMQTTSVTAGADLQLAMSGSPDPVVAGGLVTYALTATNLGPDASSTLSIVDTLPPNVTYVSGSGTGWSCSAAGSTVTCNRTGSLANAASSALSIVGRVTSSISGTITNAATLSAATPDGVPNNNTTTANVDVTVGANLAITKTASPTPMIGSAAASFTLAPRNTGPDAASTVTVIDTLPVGFTAIGASGPNWSCSVDQPTRVVTCTRATMPVGATDNITITTTAPDNSVVPAAGLSTSNTASIDSSITTDPDNTNNTGSVAFTIQRDGADMSITKTKGPNPVAQGAPITSVLTARNNGPRALAADTSITLTDTLPAGEDYSGAASFMNNGWTCTFAAPVFTCTRPGPLAINTNAPTLTLVTTATAAALLTNQGCVSLSGALADANNTNDCVSASSDSTAARADLTIVKTQNLNPVTTADNSIIYTLTIKNNGPQDSANVVISDVIPMRTTLAGGSVIAANAGVGDQGSTGSCSVVAATVTCNYSSLLYATAAPANTAETAVITITVQRPMADGPFTNQATINSTSIGDPDRANNSSSINTTVDPVADVQVQSKTVTPNPVKAGVDATYVITLRNVGPSSALGVTLEDQFNPTPGDAGYTIESYTPSAGSCSFNAGTDLLSCAIGTMAANATRTVTVVARPKWMAAPPGGRNLQNTATVSMTTVDSNASNDSKNATLNIDTALVDLISNITDVASFVGITPDPLGYDGVTLSNNIVTYRSTVTNSGPSEATTVTFTNTYTPPNGKSVTFLCDSNDQYSCSGVPVCSAVGAATVTGPTTQVVDCSAPNLNSGASYSRFLRYQVNDAPAPSGDSYSNSITVSSSETDSNSANNSANEPTNVRAKADLQVSSKVAIIATPPLQYGQPFQWQIKVLNNGPGTAHDSVLSDTLPANMELVAPFNYGVSLGAGTCSNIGVTQFSCNLGDILAGAPNEQTITVDVFIRKPATGPYPSQYTNTASVTTFSVDLVAANNSNSGLVNLVKSSIAGRVYRDHNNNGAIDGGESGISGVNLLLTGTDAFGIAVSRPATTDGSGNYLIDNLEQANGSGYTLTETQPASYSDGLETIGAAATGTAPGGTVAATIGSNTISAIVLDKDQVAAGYNFGELRQNTLSGTVFADVNNNGSKQGSEPGINNVTVTLSGTDARGTVVNTTAITNSSGVYTFNNVLPGTTYQLDETQPATYLDGIDTVGNLGGSAAVNDRFSGIVVTDVNGTGYNFAELPGSISGRVWRDANRDGVLDGSEVGIDAVTISLSGTSTLGVAVTRTGATNATGNYSFADLPAGTYTVTETQPVGYGSSTPNSISSIVLAAAGASANHDFGDSTGALSGIVFFDRNANGANDGSDTGITGVAVALTGTDAAGATVNRTAASDASGAFTFDDLLAPNGSGYTLTETQHIIFSNGQVTAGSAGGTANLALNRVTAIALTGGSAATNYRFAELGTVISGVVYRDANRNGAKEPAEIGLGGATVTLNDAGNALVATTTTVADGSYAFAPQPGGSYSVVETQPAGYQSGPQNAGNSVAIALVAGTPATVDFGESAGSFAGTVFLDGNNNGVQDGGEIGLPGVTITLSGTDANGAAVNRPAATDASGHYLFSDVLGGTYVLSEAQPAVFGDGLEVLGAGNVGGSVGNDVYSAISLPAGTQATGYNYAETGSAVTGVAFRDFNRDGTQQAGDQGIAGVTITLRDAGNTTVGTTITAADGSYLFAGVPAGSYSVIETQPLGYGSAATSPDTVTIVVPAGGAATAHFADTLSTLAGSVYIDLNNNGVRDVGEAGIAGVMITLTGTDAASQIVSRTAASDASGNFLFIDLKTPNASGYSVGEPTQPTAYADGIDAAGLAGGVTTNDLISAIHLGVNTDATGYTFGERGTTISGIVFKDANENTVFDGGDAALAVVTLTLKNGSGVVVGTTTTAADGTYSFSGLPAGNYTVEETQPAGYGTGIQTLSVTIPAGGSATADFAEITSSIAGFVFADTNNNATRDTAEPGIANVTVTLSGTDAAGASVNRSTTSDANGAYLFADVLGGTYTLTETQPAVYADGSDAVGSAGGTLDNDVISAITLPVRTHATGYLFGERGQSITGQVWRDSNRNGVLDTGEIGVAAVTITLHDSSNAVVATTTTAADGSYFFTNIPAGHYTVDETQPAGYGSSTPDSVAVDLTAGGTTPIVNFGETVGSLAGLVFNDTNNNGVRDPGEPAIPGAMLHLAGTDARGNVVSLNATTADDGRYSFIDIVGGVYDLSETQPADYGDGLDTAGTSGGTVGNDLISAITLGAAVDAAGYSFGERGTSAAITGTVWRDVNHDRVRGVDEAVLADWIVELYQGSLLMQTVTTDASGRYQLDGVAPGSGYEVRFREPTSHAMFGTPVTNEQGISIAPGAIGPSNPGGADPRGGTLMGLTLTPAGLVTEQSLPLDPMGVIYDSVSRRPIAGATVTLSGPSGFDAATHLLGGTGNAQQITNAQGIYQFLLLPTAPAGTYSIAVTPPPGRYTPGASVLIPPCAGPLTVGALPNPALVQSASAAPAASVPNQDPAQCPNNSAQLAAGLSTTQYFVDFALTPGLSANIINNNLPVDPILGGALAITKTTPLVNVSRGDLVPYTITVSNTLNALLTNVDIHDLVPPGFAYRRGSAAVNGFALEPQQAGRQLTWADLSFTPHERKVFKLVLIVGAGVSEAEYVNQAYALNNLIDAPISNVATATVRVVPDPVFDCADIIGKVFDDANVNGYQDQGEPGIPNVRLATLNGVLVTSDAEGRFHVACAAIPNEYRGSNFVMKLDERTLPSGYRLTTENPRDVRVTRGKLTKLNFGATIHRVIRIEVNDTAYEPGTLQLRTEWRDRIARLPQTLRERPSIVRVAYASGADDKLAARRRNALINQIRSQWEALHCCYPLQVEADKEIQP